MQFKFALRGTVAGMGQQALQVRIAERPMGHLFETHTRLVQPADRRHGKIRHPGTPRVCMHLPRAGGLRSHVVRFRHVTRVHRAVVHSVVVRL